MSYDRDRREHEQRRVLAQTARRTAESEARKARRTARLAQATWCPAQRLECGCDIRTAHDSECRDHIRNRVTIY